MVPRNRELPYSGWREHHIKEFSKVNPQADDGLIMLEYGELPKDNKKRAAPVLRSETEKKMKTDDIIKDMRQLIEQGKDKEAFDKYPRNFIQYGEKIKSLIHQKKKQFFGKHNMPHIYCYGFPGSGKTAMMKMVFPNYYKKDLSNRFWYALVILPRLLASLGICMMKRSIMKLCWKIWILTTLNVWAYSF